MQGKRFLHYWLGIGILATVTTVQGQPSASFPLYGTIHHTAYWYTDIHVGKPVPQRQSVIVDTGSSVTAFPCSNCQDHCGKHLDKPFQLNSSLTAQPVPCNRECFMCMKPIEEPTSFKNSSFPSQQCAYHIRYTEGSSLTGHWYKDDLLIGASVFDNARKTTPSASSSNLAVPPDEAVYVKLPFGCHTQETYLFTMQEASGILGLELKSRFGPPTFIASVLKGLIQRATSPQQPQALSNLTKFLEDDWLSRIPADSPTKPEFAICMSQSGGVLTLGGRNIMYHVTQPASQDLKTTLSNDSLLNSLTPKLTKPPGQLPRILGAALPGEEEYRLKQMGPYSWKDTSDLTLTSRSTGEMRNRNSLLRSSQGPEWEVIDHAESSISRTKRPRRAPDSDRPSTSPFTVHAEASITPPGVSTLVTPNIYDMDPSEHHDRGSNSQDRGPRRKSSIQQVSEDFPEATMTTWDELIQSHRLKLSSIMSNIESFSHDHHVAVGLVEPPAGNSSLTTLSEGAVEPALHMKHHPEDITLDVTERKGLVWTPMLLNTLEDHSDCYNVVIEKLRIQAPNNANDSTLIQFPSVYEGVRRYKVKEGNNSTLNTSGLVALVDSGTTLTYLPFMMYMQVWTSLTDNFLRQLEASLSPGSKRHLQEASSSPIYRVSGRSISMLKNRTERWLKRWNSKIVRLQDKQTKLIDMYATSRDAQPTGHSTNVTSPLVSTGRGSRFSAVPTEKLAPQIDGLKTRQQALLDNMQEANSVLKTLYGFEDHFRGKPNSLFYLAPERNAQRDPALMNDIQRAQTSYFIANSFDPNLELPQSAVPLRRLRPEAVDINDEECWLLPRGQEDFKAFPSIHIQFAQQPTEYVWRPQSYLYRKGQSNIYCLTIVPRLTAGKDNGVDEDSESSIRRLDPEDQTIVLGSSFFIDHDIVFDVQNWSLGFVEASCPQTSLSQRRAINSED